VSQTAASSLDISHGLEAAFRSRFRRVRAFKEAGKLSRRSRDEEAHPLHHPALKYRAKVTPPLRGEASLPRRFR